MADQNNYSVREMIDYGEEIFGVKIKGKKRVSLDKKIRRFIKDKGIESIGEKIAGKTRAKAYSKENVRFIVIEALTDDFLKAAFSSNKEFESYEAAKNNFNKKVKEEQDHVVKLYGNDPKEYIAHDDSSELEFGIEKRFIKRKFEIILETLFAELSYGLKEDKLKKDIKRVIEFEQDGQHGEIDSITYKAYQDYVDYKKYIYKISDSD